MSAERDAFLYAIVANPDDDTARLVFADWLEEHDEPARAEFIRLQIANAVASQREHDLMLSFLDEWFPDECCPGIRRGFSFNVEIACEEFMRDGFAKELFSRVPVESVMLPDKAPQEDHHSTIEGCSWRWYRADTVEEAAFWHALPSEIFDAMCDERKSPLPGQSPETRWWFDTLGNATAATSDALVAYGRQQAGLPAWEPPSRVAKGSAA